jgi:hypothetical protein
VHSRLWLIKKGRPTPRPVLVIPPSYVMCLLFTVSSSEPPPRHIVSLPPVAGSPPPPTSYGRRWPPDSPQLGTAPTTASCRAPVRCASPQPPSDAAAPSPPCHTAHPFAVIRYWASPRPGVGRAVTPRDCKEFPHQKTNN